MAGLYVHIPFCQRRCLYCDFFSTTRLERREAYIQAVLTEIAERKNEASEPIRTIYLGGGTPSTLDAADIARIIEAVGTNEAEEITMELNPGDATPETMHALRKANINRLSIGIQSFQDDLLAFIGRRHNAQQAIEAVRMAQEAGFDNISIDLMYALPTQTMRQWQADLQTALSLHVQHISTYGLMYEQGTPLTRQRDEGLLTPIDEDTENAMYDFLCDLLAHEGWTHYEVSNFALPGYEAKHNSAYWDGTPYIGIGAGAHSYIGRVRSWNPEDLDAYIHGILAHNLLRESETLTERDLYNEYIMLGLRTAKGISTTRLKAEYNETILDFARDNLLTFTGDERIVATRKGLHILNRIIEDLMI